MDSVKPQSKEWIIDLAQYLSDHEFDIAWGENDFESLNSTWNMFFPHKPSRSTEDNPETLKGIEKLKEVHGLS